MTEEGLRRVEGGLAITLPQEYWEFMRTRGGELKETNAELAGRLGKFIESSANDLLILNCRARKADSEMATAMPKWWKQFLMFGTDGRGGFCCVRLDGAPGVWRISADGTPPKKQFDSLADYVDHALRAARKG
jgi:SMI1/KNR4 family protein SUKH-1